MIPKSLEYKGVWLLGLLLLFGNCFTTTFRWRLLLHLKSSRHLPFFAILRLSWIGFFFSSVLPGAVTGDILKLIYARDLDKDLNKSFLLTSIFMDRLVGLLGLLFLLGIFSLLNYSELAKNSPTLANLIHFNFLIFFLVLLGLATIFLPKSIQNLCRQVVNLVPFIKARIHKLLDQVWLIGENKITVLYCFIISIITQVGNVFAFWILASPFLERSLPFDHAFTFIPLGMVAIAIPISPAGLGVGHALFNNLFAFFGINNGASLFNLYFIAMLSINLMGIFPYLFSGKKHSMKDVEKFEAEA